MGKQMVSERTWPHRDFLMDRLGGKVLKPSRGIGGVVAVMEGAGFEHKGETEDQKQAVFACKRHDDGLGELYVDIPLGVAHCFGCGYDGTVGLMMRPTSIMRTGGDGDAS